MAEINKKSPQILVKETLKDVKKIYAVISGKGGVGKTTIAVNLAASLAVKQKNVGILDLDITGPNVPKMLDLEGQQPKSDGSKILPIMGPLKMKVMSMEFLLNDPDQPVIWRGPLKMKVIQEFLTDVVWGDLDYLIVDMPPGTGDEALSLMQLIPDINGIIMVTTPQEVALLDVKKALKMAQIMKRPVTGIIENMSGFVCPKCGEITDIFGTKGGENAAKELGLDFLGKLPIDPKIREASDDGSPFIVMHKESLAKKELDKIVKKIM
ncbi:MAG: Mrp/NBP35 family ATP-binding protein [Candidatus Ranarchaeia archaeon]